MSEEVQIGRPSKYSGDVNQKAIEFLSQGKSIVQLASELMVHRDTLYEWAKVHPEFSDTLKLGQQLSQSVWEDKLEQMMYDRNVNAPLVKLYFANRFKWHDKPEQENEEGSNPAPIQVQIIATDASKP